MTKNSEIQQFFSTHVNLLNNIYAKANISTYFELFEGGFLWILKRLKDLNLIRKFALEMTEQSRSKKNKNPNHQNIKTELMGKFQMEDKEVIFEIESIFHSVKNIIGVVKHVFTDINPTIRVEERFNKIVMIFPNLDALVDYLEILFFASTTMNN
jgi:hypothetical protein